MRLATAPTAALAGVLAVVVVAPAVPAAVGLALGAVVTVALTRRGDTDRYGLAGALLLLGTGAAVLVLGRFPPAWSRTPLVALWVFGGLSLTVAVLRVILGVVGRRAVALFVAEENTESVWDAISAFLGTLVVAWSVLTAHEKAVRIGGVSLGGTATMALNAAGHEVPLLVPFLHERLAVSVAGYDLAVPVWVLERGVDATMVAFVGCVIVGFHTLGTLASTWRAVTDTTERAANEPRAGGERKAATETTGPGSTAPGRRRPAEEPGPGATGPPDRPDSGPADKVDGESADRPSEVGHGRRENR